MLKVVCLNLLFQEWHLRKTMLQRSKRRGQAHQGLNQKGHTMTLNLDDHIVKRGLNFKELEKRKYLM